MHIPYRDERVSKLSSHLNRQHYKHPGCYTGKQDGFLRFLTKRQEPIDLKLRNDEEPATRWCRQNRRNWTARH